MGYSGEFKVFEDIIQEMSMVYQHDQRPWMIGFSGGKDSTLLCCLVIEMLQRLTPEKRNKMVYIVTSDTMVENPIVRDYVFTYQQKWSRIKGSGGYHLPKGRRYFLVQSNRLGISHARSAWFPMVYRSIKNSTDE